jgi:hypothetical protein
MGIRETSVSGDENISIDQDVWVEYADGDLILPTFILSSQEVPVRTTTREQLHAEIFNWE